MVKKCDHMCICCDKIPQRSLGLVLGLGVPCPGLGLVLVPISLGKFTDSSVAEQSGKEEEECRYKRLSGRRTVSWPCPCLLTRVYILTNATADMAAVRCERRWSFN